VQEPFGSFEIVPEARKGCPKAQFEQLREIFRPRRRECLKKAASGAD